MARPKTKDPWAQLVNPYIFARALGYADRHGIPPEPGQQERYLNADVLGYVFYPDRCDIERYAKVQNADTTEYGTNTYRFDLPATLETWFLRLCTVDHLWTETPKDRAEFLTMYQDAAGEVQLDILKQRYRS